MMGRGAAWDSCHIRVQFKELYLMYGFLIFYVRSEEDTHHSVFLSFVFVPINVKMTALNCFVFS